MEEGPIDYDRLAQALSKNLEDLEHFRINPAYIKNSDSAPVVTGGFGDIQCADLEVPGAPVRKVAVKVLRPAGDSSQRLRIAVALIRELRVWSPLNHPNILPVLGFHLADDHTQAWLVSPWEEQGNLAAYLKMNQLSRMDLLPLSADTATGLAYLHGLSPAVYHGDIKPMNVLLTGHPVRALLCDFGLARIEDEIRSGLTTGGHKEGTARFRSPELVMDDNASHSTKSDVWAWGCLFLQIMTGRMPYHEEKKYDRLILQHVFEQPPAALEDLSLPREIKALMAKCWKRLPESRPTMAACCRDLENITTLLSTAPPESPTTETSSRASTIRSLTPSGSGHSRGTSSTSRYPTKLPTRQPSPTKPSSSRIPLPSPGSRKLSTGSLNKSPFISKTANTSTQSLPSLDEWANEDTFDPFAGVHVARPERLEQDASKLTGLMQRPASAGGHYTARNYTAPKCFKYRSTAEPTTPIKSPPRPVQRTPRSSEGQSSRIRKPSIPLPAPTEPQTAQTPKRTNSVRTGESVKTPEKISTTPTKKTFGQGVKSLIWR